MQCPKWDSVDIADLIKLLYMEPSHQSPQLILASQTWQFPAEYKVSHVFDANENDS